MSDIVVDIENRLAWTDEPESGRRKDGELLMRAHDEIVTLRAELAEHERRAALVAEWAEGLRAGKRYAVTVNGERWDALLPFPVDLHHFRIVNRPASHLLKNDMTAPNDPDFIARVMLAVSDQWQEVEP